MDATNDSHDERWRQSQNEQSKQIALALFGKQLAEPERYSRPLSISITAQRRLDTVDRRGATVTPPITYSEAEWNWFRSTAPELRWDDSDRKGDIPKRRRSENFAEQTEVESWTRATTAAGVLEDGWAARVIHPRWREHLRLPDPREHLFQSARADRIRREFRLALNGARSLAIDGAGTYTNPLAPRPTIRRLRRVDLKMLPVEAQQRRKAEIRFDRDVRLAQAAWGAYEKPNDFGTDAKKLSGPKDKDGTDYTGHAAHFGVQKADRLLARKRAREHAEYIVSRGVEELFERIVAIRMAHTYLATLPSVDPDRIKFVPEIAPKGSEARKQRLREQREAKAAGVRLLGHGRVLAGQTARDLATDFDHQQTVIMDLTEAEQEVLDSYPADEIQANRAWNEPRN